MSVRCLIFNIFYQKGVFCTVRTIWGGSYTREALVSTLHGNENIENRQFNLSYSNLMERTSKQRTVSFAKSNPTPGRATSQMSGSSMESAQTLLKNVSVQKKSYWNSLRDPASAYRLALLLAHSVRPAKVRRGLRPCSG